VFQICRLYHLSIRQSHFVFAQGENLVLKWAARFQPAPAELFSDWFFVLPHGQLYPRLISRA
jgi:hypothetical protein